MFPARWCATLVALAFIAVPLTGAQVTSADLVGRVTDSTGAVLPGATVTIEHAGTGDSRTQVANEAGDYVFTLLPIGRYTIKIVGRGRSGAVGLADQRRCRVSNRLPFNVTNASSRSNTGANNDRPDLIGDTELNDPTPQQWLNTTAFQAQPINTVGNSRRNPLHGPSRKQLDLSLFKDLTLRGSARLQLRIEAYNVTNTANFANPNAALGNAAFGTITSTVGHAAADAIRRDAAVLGVE